MSGSVDPNELRPVGIGGSLGDSLVFGMEPVPSMVRPPFSLNSVCFAIAIPPFRIRLCENLRELALLSLGCCLNEF
jgi:hypothetical protein